MAMYEVKRAGGAGRVIVDLREVRLNSDEETLTDDLRRALARNELDLAYQPIVRLADGAVIGVEALLRWTHPERGQVPPQLAIAVAEECDLIDELGAWILERACRDRADWMLQHRGALCDLAVNVSARQLISATLHDTVTRVLAATGMDPRALILELTESIFIEEPTRAVATLNDLKKLGVRLALDDFGSGYSSLSYLARLSLDIVKIDRGFIANIGHDPTNRAIVVAIMNLAHNLGLVVVAEGVEAQSQHYEVSATACELAQGHYYAASMPASAIGAMIGTRLRTRPALAPAS